MTSVEIISLVVTAMGVCSFSAIFTILYRNYTASSIKDVVSGKADIDLIDECIYNSKKAQEISTYDIINGIKNNDEYSLKVFNIWKKDLITGLINITNIFDPESIIISGGMGEFINTEEIENAVNSKLIIPTSFPEEPLGSTMGIYLV